MFANCIAVQGVNYFQDLEKIFYNHQFKEEDILKIHGQGSGISLKYFCMLVGSSNLIKPDRMIIRLLSNVLSREVTIDDEPVKLLQSASNILKNTYSNIIPRLLDHEIWQYQRSL